MGSYTPGFLLSGCLGVLVSGLLFVDVYLEKRGTGDSCSAKEVDCDTVVTRKASCASDHGFMNVVYFETYV